MLKVKGNHARRATAGTLMLGLGSQPRGRALRTASSSGARIHRLAVLQPVHVRRRHEGRSVVSGRPSPRREGLHHPLGARAATRQPPMMLACSALIDMPPRHRGRDSSPARTPPRPRLGAAQAAFASGASRHAGASRAGHWQHGDRVRLGCRISTAAFVRDAEDGAAAPSSSATPSPRVVEFEKEIPPDGTILPGCRQVALETARPSSAACSHRQGRGRRPGAPPRPVVLPDLGHRERGS